MAKLLDEPGDSQVDGHNKHLGKTKTSPHDHIPI